MTNFSTVPYGAAPTVLGHYPLDPQEMMIYLYLPVKMAGNDAIKVPTRSRYRRGSTS